MTKEKLDKIAKRYAQDELKDNHGQVEDIVAAAFLNGIDYAEHHPHWISVEDELPRCYIPYNNWDETPSDVLESEKVLALLSVGTICIATFNQNLDVDTDKPTGSPYWFDEGHPEDGDRIRGEVTHWMTLPQPPAVLSSLEIAEKKWGRIEYGK